MFAMFNLQLSSLDFSGEMPETQVMTPQAGPDFARLLELSAPPPTLEPSGAILPPAGSELPLQSIPVTTDMPLPNALEPLDDPIPGVGPGPEYEVLDDVVIEAQLRYPPARDDVTAETHVVVATAAPPDDVAVERLPTTGPVPAEPLRATPAPARPVDPAQRLIAPAERLLDAAAPVRREPVAVVTPAQAAPLPGSNAEVSEQYVPVDQPRRFEPAASVTAIDTTADAPKARPVVQQPVPALNIQPNPQQPLPIVTPTTTAVTDPGYAAVVQQASDAIPTAVRDPAWGEQIGERVVMMAGNQVRTAEIRLTPAELGPLRVQVSVEDGAANVTFQAQHAVTREAIEQALPRLRELLAENGLSLGQANVGEQGVAGRGRDDAPAVRDTTADADDPAETAPEPETRTAGGTGLVDTFV